MTTPTLKLYPSAPKIDSEQQLGREINDVNSFNNCINNIKEKIADFNIQNHKAKKKQKKIKLSTTIIKSLYN